MKMSTEPQALQRFSLSGATMGTRFSAVLYGASDLDLADLTAQLQLAVDQVDQQMSTWKPDSDLMQLNAAVCGEWLSVPEQLLWVLISALRISEDSAGAFEIGVGALVNACGFGPQPAAAALPGKQPSARAVLEIDPGNCRVRKHAPVTLDLNGIAKGFAVDQLARCLEQYLSLAHLHNAEKGCPLPPLAVEIARADQTVRQEAEHWLVVLHAAWSETLDDPELAWALISQCVGAVVVGRMLASETVQSELLQASRSLVAKVLA